MTEGSGSGPESESDLEKYMDPDPNPICPERLDPDPVLQDRIRNPGKNYLCILKHYFDE